ncbi:MAG: hypothetical protein A3H76_04110 [Candidatus Lloydbacteria bacterium RIFCSPLOWO2_02_FULL_54_12]|nr:MAG: hypothetical protein A3H76_04110 [Candidatus Lloydbacteria bacterium RIFCSPLOWO2_02_FULL_54_12]
MVFILGTVIGSFLNVVIYRTGSGAGLRGRSKCLSCGKVLTVAMLIPLFSYLFQGGRCAYCGAKLSVQYPLVEAASGLLFLFVWWVDRFDPVVSNVPEMLAYLFDTAAWSLLLVIITYDLYHKIILDRFSAIFALLAGVTLFLKWRFGLLTPEFLPVFGIYTSPWLDLFAGPLIMLPFTLLWFLSGGRAMGLGDAKLAFGLGWFLGLSGGISAVIFAFWTAFFPSLFLLLLPRKRFTMKSEIPFAPFLVLGSMIVFFLGVDMFTWAF